MVDEESCLIDVVMTFINFITMLQQRRLPWRKYYAKGWIYFTNFTKNSKCKILISQKQIKIKCMRNLLEMKLSKISKNRCTIYNGPKCVHRIHPPLLFPKRPLTFTQVLEQGSFLTVHQPSEGRGTTTSNTKTKHEVSLPLDSIHLVAYYW